MATLVEVERVIPGGGGAKLFDSVPVGDGSLTDTGPLSDGTTYQYRARYYDTETEEYSGWSNTSQVVFAHTLICIERKTGVGGSYAEQTVQQWRNAEWADPGPFSNGTTYYYRARIYDTTVPEYRDYGDEDSVTFGAPSASGAYYYAMLRE